MIVLILSAGIALAILLSVFLYLRNLGQSNSDGHLLLPIQHKAIEEPYTPIDAQTPIKEAHAEVPPAIEDVLVDIPKDEALSVPEKIAVIAESELEPILPQENPHVPPVISQIALKSPREDVPFPMSEKESDDTAPQPRARKRLSLRRTKSTERREKGGKNANNGGLFTGLLRRSKSPENNIQLADTKQ